MVIAVLCVLVLVSVLQVLGKPFIVEVRHTYVTPTMVPVEQPDEHEVQQLQPKELNNVDNVLDKLNSFMNGDMHG